MQLFQVFSPGHGVSGTLLELTAIINMYTEDVEIRS